MILDSVTLSLDNRAMTPDEVKALRQRLELTQEGFAKRLGVTRRTVIRLENGQVDRQYDRTLKALQRLARQAAPHSESGDAQVERQAPR